MEISLSIIVGILIANAMIFLLDKIFAGKMVNKAHEHHKTTSCTGNCGGVCSCCAVNGGKKKHWDMPKSI
jgi:hypothetical protein